jgi:hypothetical protein
MLLTIIPDDKNKINNQNQILYSRHIEVMIQLIKGISREQA